ncbi:hypothetical protein IH781_03225 [Patescibacteria group bacterium]|nr:hypothetical protein [Patescibacteria group bacterium]
MDAQLTPNTITIPEPPRSEKLLMRVAPTTLMSVSGGYLLPQRDQPEVIVVANDSGQPLIVSYATPSLWPGLILAVGLILAFITAPRLAGKPKTERQYKTRASCSG